MKQDANALDLAGQEHLTSMKHGLKSGSAWLACADRDTEAAFLEGLSDQTLAALPWLFEFWALPHQIPPEGD